MKLRIEMELTNDVAKMNHYAETAIGAAFLRPPMQPLGLVVDGENYAGKWEVVSDGAHTSGEPNPELTEQTAIVANLAAEMVRILGRNEQFPSSAYDELKAAIARRDQLLTQ